VFRKALALLDHPWLTRAGNVKTIIGIGTAAVLAAAAIVVALDKLFTRIGWVPFALMGSALIIFGLVAVQKLQERHTRPEIDGSSLWSAVYGEREKERERRAKQIAKE
jgi:hypothetical protein